MKTFLIGTLSLATMIACANGASHESAASPNQASPTEQVTTTSATMSGARESAQSSRSNAGKGISGAGDKSALGGEPKSPPAPTFATPREPAPANTGDPCPNCPEHR